MEESQSIVDEFVKISRSASMDSLNIHSNLFQLLGYRQRVAQEILENKNDENVKELISLFNYTNEQIKKLLAI